MKKKKAPMGGLGASSKSTKKACLRGVSIYKFLWPSEVFRPKVWASSLSVPKYAFNDTGMRSRKLQHMPIKLWDSRDELTVITIGANGFASFGCSIGIGG